MIGTNFWTARDRFSAMAIAKNPVLLKIIGEMQELVELA